MKKISFRSDILPMKDTLFRLALRITLSREEAEDIVQDTLIKVWNRRDSWDTIESVEAFSLTICRNIALDRLRLHANNNASLDAGTSGERQTPPPIPTSAQCSARKWRLCAPSSTTCQRSNAHACSCATSKARPTRRLPPSSP